MYSTGHFLYFRDGRLVNTARLVVPRGRCSPGRSPFSNWQDDKEKHPSFSWQDSEKGKPGWVFSFSPSHFFISRNVLQLELVSRVSSGSPAMIAFSLEDGRNDFFFFQAASDLRP